MIGMRERDAWDVKTADRDCSLPILATDPPKSRSPTGQQGRQQATRSPASGERPLQVVNA